MAIVRFNTQQFEAALPTLAAFVSIQDGERVYDIPVSPSARIVVRSSIGPSGIAKDTGDDSIRMWIEVIRMDGSKQSLSKNADLSRYTTRVEGWERRMNEKIEELSKIASRITKPISICPDCRHPKWLNITKKEGKNKGRPFASCQNRAHSTFEWMDEGSSSSNPPNKERGSEPTKDAFSKQESSKASDLFGDVELSTSFQMEEEIEEAPPPKRELNPQQMAIVKAGIDKAIRVIAGPGSGKTTVSEARIVELIREYGAKPGEILYTTFSKPMADEGGKRIGKTLSSELGMSPIEIESYQKWLCTIHAACFRILKAEGDKRQVADKEWKIKKVLEPLVEEYWEDCEFDNQKKPKPDEVFKAICNAKMYAQRAGNDLHFFNQFFGSYHGERLTLVRKLFDENMKKENLITFPDMIYEVERRLTDEPAFLRRWQSQFKYIIVDEGQDTNAQAMRVLTKLAEGGAQFMVVGDVDQLLYRFTGATPEANLYDGFSRLYPDGLLFFLEKNYRSTSHLVQMANNVIKFNYEEDGGPYASMFKKTLCPRDDALEGLKASFQNYEDPVEEAHALVQNIQEQLARGREPGDMFVGSRTRAQLGYLEGPLTVAGIKFINITGGSFWNMKHVNDVVSYLRLAHDPENKEAFKRVYNIASNDFRAPWGENKGEYVNQRWLGAAFLEACSGKMTNMRYAARSRRAWMPGVLDIESLMTELNAHLHDGPRSVLQAILDNCYEDYLKYEEGNPEQDEADGGKLNDLQTVLDLASRFNSIPEFLRHVDDAMEAAEKARNKEWGEYVVLSTIHRLKGLERPIVFLVGMSEGEVSFPDGTSRPYGLLPHTFSLTDPPQMGAFNFGGRGRIEDERCIAFVGITRAKEEVYLSGVEHYRKATMWPSRFVYEMGILQGNEERGEVEFEEEDDILPNHEAMDVIRDLIKREQTGITIGG